MQFFTPRPLVDLMACGLPVQMAAMVSSGMR